MRTRTLKEVANVLKKAQKDLIQIKNETPEKYKEELEEIGKEVMADWYADYDPFYDGISYDRTGNLKQAYKVTVEGSHYSVDFSPEYMDDVYMAKNEDGSYSNPHWLTKYIYENSFIKGYHGGATDGPNHPRPGTPYYKEYPEFSIWTRPAVRSFSPYAMMNKRMKEKIAELDEERQEKVKKIIDRVDKSVSRLGRR